jgi:hypothetical protein
MLEFAVGCNVVSAATSITALPFSRLGGMAGKFSNCWLGDFKSFGVLIRRFHSSSNFHGLGIAEVSLREESSLDRFMSQPADESITKGFF